MHIDHIAIWIKNLEKQKEFYTKNFDCTAGNKYVNPAKKFSSYFLTFASGSRIELMHRDDVKEGTTDEKMGYTHLALHVDSRTKVNELTSQIEKDGHCIAGKVRQTGDGYYESVILDPEGNRIEIVAS